MSLIWWFCAAFAAEGVVAKTTLDRGHIITMDDVAMRTVSDRFLVDDAPTDRTQVVGRMVRFPILAGEWVRPRRLVNKQAGSSHAALIPRGMQSVAIGTPSGFVGQVSGLVDVVLMGPSPCYLLTGLMVHGLERPGRLSLATEDHGGKDVQRVHLLVEPLQAAMVFAAPGELQLVGRPFGAAATTEGRCQP